MRIDHRAAAGDIAEKENCEHCEKKKCGAQISRAKIKPGVNEVNGEATRKNSPAAAVGPLPIDESNQTEGKHAGQGSKLTAGIHSEKRG